MFGLSLREGAAVVDKLLERYGAARLRQVEQLSRYSFRARLSGGGIALAVIGGDGRIWIREPEADVCAEA